MTIVYVLLPLSLLLAATFTYLFYRSARSGQFTDCDTPAMRAIFDDDEIEQQRLTTNERKENGAHQ